MKKFKLEIYFSDEETVKDIIELIGIYSLSHKKKFYALKGEFGVVEVKHIHMQIDEEVKGET